MLNNIREFADNYPKSLGYKIEHKIATLKDQDEALKSPRYAYYFARFIPGSNIEKCQEAACQYTMYAYYFARDISKANIEKCRIAASRDEYWKKIFEEYFGK